MTENIEIPAFITSEQQAQLARAHQMATGRRKPDPLLSYIQDVQDRAVRLHGVLCAIDHLDNESACADGMTALIHIARDLQRDLDGVNLPEGRTDG
ncbi:hypothetical protein VK792_07815 [Mesobacterium sp. TK19101]|uniref:Uncharacterized protein n=1 Tax=Mesobacterium hydrothermale TaxID=3111907 RepID=A0ABU6HGW9_9RHOB|nr:hypothetical protein [Mesobacterium sp. TK19101]MEC3861186.1 hypothetical protein [Mesobacterium sp. TK19101]